MWKYNFAMVLVALVMVGCIVCGQVNHLRHHEVETGLSLLGLFVFGRAFVALSVFRRCALREQMLEMRK